MNLMHILMGDSIPFKESENNSVDETLSDLRKEFPDEEFYYDGEFIHRVPGWVFEDVK